jgi:hypothetical protein
MKDFVRYCHKMGGCVIAAAILYIVVDTIWSYLK